MNKLEQFGREVLRLMEEHEDWNSDFTQEIGEEAFRLGLGKPRGSRQLFKVAAILPDATFPQLAQDDLITALEIARVAIKCEFTMHHVGCEVDLTDECLEELGAKLDAAMTLEAKPMPKRRRAKPKVTLEDKLKQAFRAAFNHIDGAQELDNDEIVQTVSLGDDYGAYVRAWVWVSGRDLAPEQRKLFRKWRDAHGCDTDIDDKYEAHK